MAVEEQPTITRPVDAFGPRLFAPFIFQDEMVIPVGFSGAKVAKSFSRYLKNPFINHSNFFFLGADRVLLTEMKNPALE